MSFQFYIFLAFSSIILTNADVSDDALTCDTTKCPIGSMMCMSTKKSTENLQSLAIAISCLTSNGTLMQNSETVIPNPTPQKKSDITSFSMLNLNTTKQRQQEILGAIIDVIRRHLANQPIAPGQQSPGYPGMPGYQPGMPGAPSQYGPPTSGPVITITNSFGMPPYQSSAYSSFMNRNTCTNPPCFNNLPPSPPTTSANGGNPNLMPTSLEAVYEQIMKMRNCMTDLEKAVQDASAAVPPPTYGPANNVAFPVTMPYNPNVNSFK